MSDETLDDGRADDSGPRPPARLRQLASWQSNKVAVLGARLTAQHMPLTARGEFAVLAALEEYGARSQADLGRLLGLDRNEVSGIVTRLENSGGIDRQPDPADRRRNVVTITAEGQRRLEEIQRYADTAQHELLAGLDPAERQQLVALLAKVLASHRPQPA
jgi:DNA-binding MarR family transcriptional regulator